MKNYFFCACAATTMLFAASCSSDDFATPVDGNSTTIQFTAQLPSSITRAFADGTTASQLQYAVYLADTKTPLAMHGTDKATVGTASFTDLTANVNLQLVTGKSYDIIFWADAAVDDLYTFDAENQSITVDYTKAVGNSDAMDAFFAKQTITVSAAASYNVSLTRPFAQLNIGTNDIAAASAAGVTPFTSAVTVSSVYSTFNLATGAVSGEQTNVTFSATAIPSGEGFPVNNYDYLAMDYLLVPADKSTIDVTVQMNDGIADMSFAAVPVQRNYRTNIYGSLLTDAQNFTVTIAPAFASTDYEVWDGKTITSPEYDAEKEAYIIDSPSDLAGFLTGNVTSASRAATSKNFILEGNIDLGGNTLQPQTGLYDFYKVVFDGQNYTVSGIVVPNSQECGLFPKGVSTTVKNVTFANITIGDEKCASGDQYAGVVFGTTYGSCVVENVNVVNSKVYGVNKVGAIYGFAAEDNATISNCTVDGCEVYGIGSDAGCVGGILGYVNANVVTTIENCSVSNTIISAKDGQNNSSRGNSYILGTTNGKVTITNCKIGNGNSLVSNCTWNPYVGSNRGNGEVTIDDEIVEVTKAGADMTISTVAELQALSIMVNSGISFSGKTITLNNDIDLNNIEWKPISTYNVSGKASFQGTFDGNGHTVKNFYTSYYRYGNGFFGDITGATIKNFTIENATIGQVAGNILGIVTGYANGKCSFENITVKNSKIHGYGKVGGIIGMMGAESTLTNCKVEDVDITGTYNCGGLIGLSMIYSNNAGSNGTISISNCTVTNVNWIKDDPEVDIYVDASELPEELKDGNEKGLYWKNGNKHFAAYGQLFTTYYNYIYSSGYYYSGECIDSLDQLK